MTTRCSWPSSELDIAYHDREWGVPVHDDRILFEFLTLEGAQAGLSWATILKKRENYRRAFAGFAQNISTFLPPKCRNSRWTGVGSTAAQPHSSSAASNTARAARISFI